MNDLSVAWRVLVLLLLVAIVGELAITNRQLVGIHRTLPDQTMLDGIGENIDQIHMDIDELSRRTESTEGPELWSICEPSERLLHIGSAITSTWLRNEIVRPTSSDPETCVGLVDKRVTAFRLRVHGGAGGRAAHFTGTVIPSLRIRPLSTSEIQSR